MRDTTQRWLIGIGRALGLSWFPYQLDFFEWVDEFSPREDSAESRMRTCLYFRTGAGKSITALAALAIIGEIECVVIAPPSTHAAWVAQGKELNIRVTAMSHAKFRMAGTKLHRDVAVIADEFHLFGGHTGKGWKKLDTLSRGLRAPLILASATPNYNDAERVYCIQHVLDPNSVKGGYLQFLYANCATEQDYFSSTPKVLGFLHHKDAASYLSSLPGVHYLPDDLVYTIQDFPIAEKIPPEMEEFGYNRRKNKIISSIIEERHDRIALSLIDDKGKAQQDVVDWTIDKIETAVESVLIFAAHSTVARALHMSLTQQMGIEIGMVTGDTSTKQKQLELDRFRAGEIEVLIGTASLATGTDGLDKVCDMLLIVDDTDDDAMRRQLIGRIMPRGVASSALHKQVHRLVLL